MVRFKSALVSLMFSSTPRCLAIQYAALQHILMLSVCSCLFFPSFSVNATPLLSSKAIRVALQAKNVIGDYKNSAKKGEESGPSDEGFSNKRVQMELQKAVHSLESLFSDSSFKRLETKDQVDIILLLSTAYEQLQEWQKQEKLLSSYSKKREFHRYYITLQIELAKSHVIRDHYIEAEKILAQLIGKSCASYPLEEKQKIAAILLMKEKILQKRLIKADLLKKSGSFQEAAYNYEIILKAIKRNTFPFQCSRLQRKQLKHKVAISLAESLLCCGDYHRCIAVLEHEKWEEDLLEKKLADTLSRKREMILALSRFGIAHFDKSYDHFLSLNASLTASSHASLKNQSERFISLLKPFIAQKESSEPFSSRLLFSSCREAPFLNTWQEPSDTFLSIWNAFFLYAQGEDEIADQLISEVKHELHRTAPDESAYTNALLDGIKAFRNENYAQAKELLEFSLFSLKAAPFYTAHQLRPTAAALLAELYAAEAYFYDLLHKEGACHRMLKKLEYLALEEKSEYAQKKLAEWQKREPHSEAIEKFNAYQKTAHLPDRKKAIFSKCSYLDSIFTTVCQYKDALQGDSDTDESILLLSKLRSSLSDYEGKAIVDHCIIDIWLQSDHPHEALQGIEMLINAYPSYEGIPNLILHALSKTHTLHSSYMMEREALLSQLFSRFPQTTPAFLAVLLDPYASQFCAQRTQSSDLHQSLDIVYFASSVAAWKRALTLNEEAESTKEPGFMKDKYQASFQAYKEAIHYAEMALKEGPFIHEEARSGSSAITPASITADFIALLDYEWITRQFKVMRRQEAAYNELGDSLQYAARLADTHRRSFQYTNVQLNEAVDISPIYIHAFHGELEQAKRHASHMLNRESQQQKISPQMAQAIVFLCELMRENGMIEDEEKMICFLDEASLQLQDHELALQLAMEKAYMYRELKEYDKAMANLASVINDSFVSSLRVRAMLVRAEIYLEIERYDLALRQLEAVASKGGEWAHIAERKLEELAWR